MSEENVLFLRKEDDAASDDVWDDSALIKAYDKAINLAKEEVSKRLGVKNEHNVNKQKKSHNQKQNRQKAQKKWCVGSPCRAIYSEDGEPYEAIISEMYETNGTCLVKFIGYNNTEIVELASLVESDGLQSQIAQQKEATASGEQTSSRSFNEKVNGILNDSMDCENSDADAFRNIYGSSTSYNMSFEAMPPAPPLPPQLMANLPENDSEALSSMLMSWYISGFHTGFYHGLKQANKRREFRKK